MSKRRRKKTASDWRDRLRDVLQTEPDVRKELRKRGLCLRVGLLERSGVVIAFHWMIEEGRTRIVNYWPTNGKWHAPETDSRGVCLDPLRIVEVASMAATGGLIGSTHVATET